METVRVRGIQIVEWNFASVLRACVSNMNERFADMTVRPLNMHVKPTEEFPSWGKGLAFRILFILLH
jgi:hypothetical protein